jgi:hypothetical protein
MRADMVKAPGESEAALLIDDLRIETLISGVTGGDAPK